MYGAVLQNGYKVLLHQIILQELQDLQKQKLIRYDVNPVVEANVLLALVNGISLDTLIQAQPLNLDQQQAVLRSYVYGLSQPVE